MTNLDKAIEKFAKDVVYEAQRNIGAKHKGRKIDSSGALRKGLMYTKKKKKSGLSITFGAKPELQDYASVVEYGRRKGAKAPPPDAIIQWFKDKPIRYKEDGKFTKATKSKINSMAYLIGQKIKRDGIVGRRYYGRAIETMMKKHQETIAMAYINDLELNLVFEQ